MQEEIAIDPEYLKSRLRELLAIPSPTGFTDEAVRYIARELERLGLEIVLIPTVIDQNPCAHFRRPMDMILHGRSCRVLHA